MQLSRLHIARLRNLQAVELRPGPGLNLLLGGNGAGKTSVLEAIHLLAYGRSFRGRVRDGLVRTSALDLEVFAEWDAAGVQPRRAGLRHTGQSWEGRLDGQPVAQLSELCASLAALTFEPGSPALLAGSGEGRRRYLDWGLFHVEQDSDFLHAWRRYARALKQRNALLKQRPPASAAQLAVWEQELAAAGEPLTSFRLAYLERLAQPLREISDDLLPQLGQARFEYSPGWKRSQLPLADALLLARERDLFTGFTSIGPHRADWALVHSGRPAQEPLSRGQGKLAALSCLLAQGEDFAAQRGQWPVVLLDDVASELDAPHLARLLARLTESRAQVFITGTEAPALPAHAEVTTFHVEQGGITQIY